MPKRPVDVTENFRDPAEFSHLLCFHPLAFGREIGDNVPSSSCTPRGASGLSSDSSFDDLIARLRRGDADAGVVLFERFANRLIALARRHLDGRLRGKVDPEDVMQSVFKSFLRLQREEAVVLRGWDDLWSLLTVIALRKCGHRLAHYLAARRDIRRESAPPAQGDEEAAWEAIAREPTPLEAAMLGDTLEQLLRPLELRDQQLVALALQGYTREEIAKQLDCTKRTVFRIIERLRGQMERLAGGAD
jgi:RNA polymerase sigma factor (sigma-70 family)